ncbi:chromosome segregation during meiosis domain-containing protein [Phthorimaea operculella]|nr:chromosome segregation during meiosis domain-containing protein [Phthorimaea operculella]
MGKPKICSRPFQCISLDLIGPLPMSRRRNQYILVVTCCFTKYCLLFPLKRALASNIISNLENLVFLVHGVPQTIIMDNGPQFRSREFNNLLTKYKIPFPSYSPHYCPQVNPTERYNRTIITALASLVDDDHRSWDLHLPSIQNAMNNSVNVVTGYTPSFLVYGREIIKGHINLGPNGYRVARSGTIQVSLFNPHGTLVKMFVVLYDLTCMPPMARTFLRQRTLYMPAGAEPPAPHELYKWLRYLIHLRFMTSKSGKLYLHTDIRILVSRKADLDTATAHSALFRPIPTNHSPAKPPPANHNGEKPPTNEEVENTTNQKAGSSGSSNRSPNRVFGGCGEYEESKMNIGYDNNQNGVSYELRSFTYAPENPRYSPR